MADFGSFTNAIAPLLIALESCSMAQTGQPSSSMHSKKHFSVGGCRYFVSDVTSEVVLGSF